MKPIRTAILVLMICVAGVLQITEVFGIQQKENESGTGSKDRITIETARDRAENMADVYESTLEMLHHRYFHRDRSLLPARAMEDIFADMKRRTKIEARWISVNTRAMNIDHEPDTDFEKQAAREIAAGKPSFEAVEEKMYRRVSAIPLKSGCVGCHAGSFAASSKTPRFAGLVVSIPLTEE